MAWERLRMVAPSMTPSRRFRMSRSRVIVSLVFAMLYSYYIIPIPMQTRILLVILDGWGHRQEHEHNAIAAAKTPFYDWLLATYPHALLEASGEGVGLPEGQIGNSEIGHMTMGGGRVFETDLVRLNKLAKSGSFSQNPEFQKLFAHVTKHDSTLHIMGLVSPGGVHSHHEHLHAFLEAAKAGGV